MVNGRFITLEGAEGAGKTSQARLLAAELQRRGYEVVLTREPGGTPAAEAIREILKSPDLPLSLEAEILLFAAARADHVENLIRPALARGAWVVCDRFIDSSIAIQGDGRNGDEGLIKALIRRLQLTPSLVFVLDLPAERVAERVAGRGEDRFDRLGLAFHARVASSLRVLAEWDPDTHVVIDASQEVGAVHAQILAAVEKRLVARV